MPCIHKFHDYLHLENINYQPTTLIVGTFNPQWPVNNMAQWFYGRTNNNHFWDVLPQIYGQAGLINDIEHEWKSFCADNLIAITDLIYSIDDAEIANPLHYNWLSNYSDDNIANKFHFHTFVNVIALLANNPTINNVYLTRGITSTFWANLWNPVINYCNENGVRVRQLLTPSGNARFQLGRYNKTNPNNTLNLPDFILMSWLSQWHQL
jgi:hypothetical protein